MRSRDRRGYGNLHGVMLSVRGAVVKIWGFPDSQTPAVVTRFACNYGQFPV